MASRGSVALRGVVGVVVALCAVAGVGGALARRSDGASPSAPAPAASPTTRLLDLEEAVERTLAAHSARFVATTRRADGPVVDLVGVTSFEGPAGEVSATIGRGAPMPIVVRRTSSGAAWVRGPDGGAWTPIPMSRLPAVGPVNGWAELVRSIAAGRDQVWLDARGRNSRVRRTTAEGVTLEVRFADFGVDLPPEVPP